MAVVGSSSRLLPQRRQLQVAALHLEALGHAQVDALVAVLVERIVTVIEEGAGPAQAPFAQPAGRAAVAGAQAPVGGVAGPGVDIGVGQRRRSRWVARQSNCASLPVKRALLALLAMYWLFFRAR
jgi:hypothetical protein